jgi:hypothetical protein
MPEMGVSIAEMSIIHGKDSIKQFEVTYEHYNRLYKKLEEAGMVLLPPPPPVAPR